jgi:hypothetical protein
MYVDRYENENSIRRKVCFQFVIEKSPRRGKMEIGDFDVLTCDAAVTLFSLYVEKFALFAERKNHVLAGDRYCLRAYMRFYVISLNHIYDRIKFLESIIGNFVRIIMYLFEKILQCRTITTNLYIRKYTFAISRK